MTTAQRSKLLGYWWPAACAAAGWNPKDREKRLAVLSEAVGRTLESASDLTTTEDIDKVKAHLLSISEPANLKGQVDAANQPRTRLLYAIRSFDLHANYIRAISRNIYGTDDWESLPNPRLENLRNVLANRARAKAKKALSISSTSNEAEKKDMEDNVPF